MTKHQKDLTALQIKKTLNTFNCYAKTYAEEVEWKPEIMRSVKEDLILPFSSRLKDGADLAIFGSGTGRDVKVLSSLGHNCVGYDICPGMIKEAKKRVPGCSFIHADITKETLPQESFDGIFSDSVFSYLKTNDLEILLDKIYSYLRPGGILLGVFKTNSGSNHIFKDTYLPGVRFCNIYSTEKADSLVENSGLSIVGTSFSEDLLGRGVGWYRVIAVKS